MSRPKIYTWGEWRYEPTECRLLHHNEPVTLPAKTLDLLTLLIARAPRLATKEEILTAVWPDATVEEGNIAFHVAALRKTLDGDATESCIETVRGRGYRFVAPVVAKPIILPPSTQSLDLPAEVKAMPIAVPSPSWQRPTVMIALGIAAIVTASLAIYALTTPTPILIAPFEVDDEVAAAGDFDESLMNAVVAQLAQSKINAVAKESGSAGDRLLTSRITMNAQQRWEVSLRLLRVDDGMAVWSWRFVASREDDRAQLEAEIAKRIADGLKSHLTLIGR